MPPLTLDSPSPSSAVERILGVRDQNQRLFAFGIHYGFPICCITQFVAEFGRVVEGFKTPDRRPTHNGHRTPEEQARYPWCGSGFIPCSKCAPVARADWPKFVAERIVPNRLHPQPFPQDGF